MTDCSYVCPNCGKEHDGLPTDWGFRFPDEVHGLPLLDQYRRTRSNNDLCTLDESRYFIRGLLSIPFFYQEGDFSWGVWIEVDREVHDFYLAHFHDDHAAGTKAKGLLANDIPGFEELAGQALDVELRDSRSRPSLIFPVAFDHPLATDQRTGIPFSRHHEFLELCGYFDDGDP